MLHGCTCLAIFVCFAAYRSGSNQQTYTAVHATCHCDTAMNNVAAHLANHCPHFSALHLSSCWQTIDLFPVQVTACESNGLYVVNIQQDSRTVQQCLFNSATNCIGTSADSVSIASMFNNTIPDNCTDPAYAASAGIPLPVGYTAPPASPTPNPLNINPCLGQEAGYYNGLNSTFYSSLYASGSASSYPLAFPGTGSYERWESVLLLSPCVPNLA